MRFSAKMNLFFGVPEVGEQYLPRHLAYLASYFKKGRLSPFFFVSVVASCVIWAWIVWEVVSGEVAVSTGWVLLASGASWPSTYDGANAVRVRFTCGYGPAASDVPADVVAWMKLQVGALYRNREGFAAGQSVAELPGRFFDALLDAERVYL
jgi:hypothetical protein